MLSRRVSYNMEQWGQNYHTRSYNYRLWNLEYVSQKMKIDEGSLLASLI